MSHVHPCPECYCAVACDLPEQVTAGADLRGFPVVVVDGCTIEPDMARDDGTPSGSYVVCEACSAPDPLFARFDLVTAWVGDVDDDAPERPLLRGPNVERWNLGVVGDAIARTFSRLGSWILNTARS